MTVFTQTGDNKRLNEGEDLTTASCLFTVGKRELRGAEGLSEMLWGSLGLPGPSKHILERRLLNVCLQSVFLCRSYFVLQHTTFWTVLFVTYDKVQSPGFVPGQPVSEKAHLTPSFPSTFNQHQIGIRYMDDVRKS